MAAQPLALRREIGRWDLLGLTLNSIVGAGILGLPGQIYALVGSWGLAFCLAGGVLMGLVASCFAETGSRFTRTGGVYVYVGAAFGPRIGFVAGWLHLVARLFGFGAIANLATTYLAALLPVVATPFGRIAFITSLTASLTVPIWRGVRVSAMTHNAFSLIKVALLLGFVACAIPAFVVHGVPATPLPPPAQWGRALILLLFGLAGAEGAVISNGEMRDPARDLPFAMLAGMACIVAIYCAVLLAAAATVPDLAHSSRPVFDGFVRMLGPWVGGVVVAGGVVSMAGVMFVTLFAGPRALFAMARAGQLPRAVGRLDARTGVPSVSVLIHVLIAWGLAMFYGFLGALAASALTRLVLYAAVALSSVILRRRGFSETAAPVALPWGRTRAGIVVLLCAAVMSQASATEAITVCAAVAIGFSLTLPRFA